MTNMMNTKTTPIEHHNRMLLDILKQAKPWLEAAFVLSNIESDKNQIKQLIIKLDVILNYEGVY